MSNTNTKERLPYRLRERFLTSPELALLSALQDMVDDRYVICPKVSLNDIFFIQRPNENTHFYNKIFRKHVDFLLCEPGSMKPAIGVELLRSNTKEATRSADQFMADLFLSAGLPLVHVPSGERYEIADLVNLFRLAISKAKEAEASLDDTSADSAPFCPKCGLMMVLRVHRQGSKAGMRYYGCMNAPACGGVVAID